MDQIEQSSERKLTFGPERRCRLLQRPVARTLRPQTYPILTSKKIYTKKLRGCQFFTEVELIKMLSQRNISITTLRYEPRSRSRVAWRRGPAAHDPGTSPG